MQATHLRCAASVITVSDRCSAGTREDLSGPAVATVLREAGASVHGITVVPDDVPAIVAAIRDAAVTSTLIITTGGTGLSPRDVTPEATLSTCDRVVPGIAELIRLEGARQTPFAALGRGVCATLGSALVLNLPGSPRGAETSLRTVLPLLPHALNLLSGRSAHADEAAPDA